MIEDLKVPDYISIVGISISILTIIALYYNRNQYPIKQQSFLLSLFFIIFSSAMFGIRLFYESQQDMCTQQMVQNQIFCSFHDNWIYIVFAIHYRFFVICQLQEDRYQQILQLSLLENENENENIIDSKQKKPNSYSILDKYFTLDITNNIRLNKIISYIFLNEIICIIFIIFIIAINVFIQVLLKNSILLDEIEDIITQLLFLHIIYLQGKLIYEFQQKTQLILLLILRDIIESMDIVQYKRVYLCYILIFLIQAVFPILLSFKIRKFHLVNITDLTNLPQGEGIQIEIFEAFKQQTQNESLDDFKKTVSYAALDKMARINHRVKDTLCNFGLF